MSVYKGFCAFLTEKDAKVCILYNLCIQGLHPPKCPFLKSFFKKDAKDAKDAKFYPFYTQNIIFTNRPVSM